MKVFGFGPESGRRITQHGSDFSLSRLAAAPGLHVGCMRLGPGGRVGYHPATLPQLFIVVEGEGWARGEGRERRPLRAGEAAYWAAGERHEVGTETGLVALVVECDRLEDEAVGPAPGR